MSDDVLEDHWDAWGSTAAHTQPRLILSPSTLGPSSEHNTSRPESLPTNKIISDILLMNQNYIKSLKVDEYPWQMDYFRGSIGSEPRHLAPVWHTPRQENSTGYSMFFSEQLLGWSCTTWQCAICRSMVLPDNTCMFLLVSAGWSVIRKHILVCATASAIATIVLQHTFATKKCVCTVLLQKAEGIMQDFTSINNILNFLLWSGAWSVFSAAWFIKLHCDAHASTRHN